MNPHEPELSQNPTNTVDHFCRPLELLMNEHRMIGQVLDCLEHLAEQATVTGFLDRPAAQDALEFLRVFADQCHHGKEESILFQMLARKGLSRQYGRSGVMVYEHNQGRRHIRSMVMALEDDSQQPQEAVKRFVGHARAYVDLMRRHIRKEDHCLFPMVQRTFSEDDQQFLLEAFATAKSIEAESIDRYVRLARNLGKRRNPAERPAEVGGR